MLVQATVILRMVGMVCLYRLCLGQCVHVILGIVCLYMLHWTVMGMTGSIDSQVTGGLHPQMLKPFLAAMWLKVHHLARCNLKIIKLKYQLIKGQLKWKFF